VLYALILTGGFEHIVVPPSVHRLLASDTVSAESRVVSGMRSDGTPPSGHLVGALGNWCREDNTLLLLHRRLARADQRICRHAPHHGHVYDQCRRLDRRRPRSEKSTSSYSRSWRARRALPALSMVIAVPWLERVPTYKSSARR